MNFDFDLLNLSLFYRLGTSNAKPILMVAERTVLTSLKEAAANRVATAIHWETVSRVKEVADVCKEDSENKNKEAADDAKNSPKVAYQPRLGDLEIPNTLKSEIERFL